MSDEQREKEQETAPKKTRVAAQGLVSHFTLAYIDEHMCWNLGCFSAGNAWPTALLAAFVWWEVASPTAFEKKQNKK